MKLADQLPFSSWRAKTVKMLSIVLVAALLWSTAGIVPTAKAGPIGPNFTWEFFDDRQFVDVAYGNGVYVAISETTETIGYNQNKTISKLWTSVDMLNWQEVDLSASTTRPFATVLYYNDRFVLTAKHSSATVYDGPTQVPLYTGEVMFYSMNGENWTALPHSIIDNLYNTAYTSGVYFGGRYIIGAANSNNGRTFNPSNSTWGTINMLPASSYHNDLIVHDGKLFVGGWNYNAPQIAFGVTMDGGDTWTTSDSNVIGSIQSFASNGSTLVGVGKTAESNATATPAAMVINYSDLSGLDMTKGTLSEPYEPKIGAFISASYSVTENQFLALSNKGDVYYSADNGVTWHPDYSTMEAGTGLISTNLGDFAFTSAGVFKRVDNLGDHTVTSSVTGTAPSATTFAVTVDDSNAVPVSEAGVVYSTADTRLPGDPQQAGVAGLVVGSNKTFDVTVSGLDGGTDYYYWPYSKDAMGYIYYGDRGSFTTIVPAEAPTLLTQPEDATVTEGDPGPTLSVTAVVYDGGALTYQWYSNIERSNNGGDPVDGAVNASFTAPTDTVGTLYYYAGVTNTVTGDGWTDDTTTYSSPAKVTVYPNLPKVIDDISDQTLIGLETGYAPGTQETRSIDIMNIGTTDLEHIAVALSGLHADSFAVTQPPATLAKGAPAASFTVAAVDGLQAGTYEAVVTVTADGMAPVSFKVLQLVNNANAPEIPQSLTAVGGSGEVELNWDTVTGATYYNVYMSTSSLQYGATPLTSAYGTDYTATGLTNGTTYYFVVRSVSVGESGFSNQVSATPMSVPDAPTDVTARAGNKQVRLNFTAPNNGGSPITGYEVLTSSDHLFEFGTSLPIVVKGLQNGQVYTFEVRAVNAAGPGEWSAVSNEAKPFQPEDDNVTGDDQGGVAGAPGSSEDDAAVLVNGKVERIGKASTAEVGGRAVTTIAVDEEQLRERLAQAGQSPVITLPVEHDSDVIIGELTGSMVEELEGYGAVVEIRTPRGTYALPAAQIDIAAVAGQFGGNVDLQNITLRVEIAVSGQAAARAIEQQAARDGFEVIGEPVHFAVTAVYNGSSIEIDSFNQYVERSIAIQDGVDASKITTGVVLDADGTLRHVPTYVTETEGRYHAVINSLTNSDYAVVWNPLEFGDTANHWSKAAVNDMGSRLIVSGIADGLFGPDRSVTRAEFAAIVANGLGLKPQSGVSQFSDVGANDWFAASVNAATAYGLISGYEDGTFRPQELITREQAMVIIAKAMGVTGLKAKLPTQTAVAVLRPYTDGADVSAWAASSVADNVQSGIAQGKGNGLLDLQAHMTRAEAAVLIRQLLEKSGLI